MPDAEKNPERRWASYAEWDSNHGFYENKTTDIHDTKDQAEAVIRGLMKNGLGGERIHFPNRVWVEPQGDE